MTTKINLASTTIIVTDPISRRAAETLHYSLPCFSDVFGDYNDELADGSLKLVVTILGTDAQDANRKARLVQNTAYFMGIGYTVHADCQPVA